MIKTFDLYNEIQKRFNSSFLITITKGRFRDHALASCPNWLPLVFNRKSSKANTRKHNPSSVPMIGFLAAASSTSVN